MKTPLQRFQPAAGCTLRVVGYDDGAKAAIAASNGNGKDFIEVPWSMFDSVLWIMERVEGKLRIPLSTWVRIHPSTKTCWRLIIPCQRLAGGGQVLQPGLLAAYNSNFQKVDIEFFLVPANVIKEYLATNIKKHVWKKLSPRTTDSDAPIEKAEATYHLIRPHPPPHWQDYLTLRRLTDRTFGSIIDDYSGEDLGALLLQIRDSVEATLGRTDFEEEQAKVIFDCLIPLQHDIEDDMDGNVIDGMVYTRIFSPHKASAVDVYWVYHRRTRYESIEFSCKLLFRVLEHTELARASSRDFTRGVPTSGRHGWNLFFEMGLAGNPPPVDDGMLSTSWNGVSKRLTLRGSTMHSSETKANPPGI